MDATLGALVEPAGNGWRAAHAACAADGDRVLVIGPGTIGLLAAMFVRMSGAEVHLLGITEESLDFARSIGFEHTWPDSELPEIPFDAVINAANAADAAVRALELVEPSGHVVYIGLAGTPSPIDTRTLTLKDVTAVGILSASPGLDPAIAAFAAGELDPRPLVGATTGLAEVSAVLAGQRPSGAGAAPKMHVDPTMA